MAEFKRRLALKLGKPVVGLKVKWRLDGIKPAATPEEAVEVIFTTITKFRFKN